MVRTSLSLVHTWFSVVVTRFLYGEISDNEKQENDVRRSKSTSATSLVIDQDGDLVVARKPQLASLGEPVGDEVQQDEDGDLMVARNPASYTSWDVISIGTSTY